MTDDNRSAAQWMRQVRFLSGISDEDFAKLTALAAVERRPARDVLFREGDVCDRLYLVVDGSVALDMRVPRRGQRRLLTVGPGEIVGWSAMLHDERMTAIATVLESVTLVAFSARELRELCDADHDVGYALMRQLSVALSRRLLATRLQMLDVFGDTQPVTAFVPGS